MSKRTRRASAAVIIGLAACLTVSCSAEPRRLEEQPRTSIPVPSVAVPELQDPLIAVDDRTSPDYLDDRATPVLHVEGTGSEVFAAELPRGARSISVYVACKPAAEFRVETNDNFFAGTCAPRFETFAEIPVDATKVLEVTLTVPQDVRRFLVVLPNG